MSRPISPARKRVFGVVAVTLPLIFFVLIELTLRLVGYGAEYPLFVEVPGYADYLVPNPDVGRRYFSLSSVVPGPPHDAFRREKSGRTIRLFVQGGSTGAGFPYGHGGMFSRMLRQRLIKTFPDRHVEVVNTSMAAVNSYTLLDFADEILEVEPDAILVYAGHNEYYGALGVGSVESPVAGRMLVRWMLALDQFRIVQALRSILAALRGPATPPDERAEGVTLMEEMAGNTLVDYGDPLFHAGIDQFRNNLTELLCRYRGAGVPVYIGTLVSNERNQAPLESGFLPDTDVEEWRRQRDRTERLVEAADTLSALREAIKLVQLDSTSADGWYEWARVSDWAGRPGDARAGYHRARDLDRLRFRAPGEMNGVIRDVAENCAASVVDLSRTFSEASHDGIIGDDFLLEHVHPNLDGYLLMSNTFYESLREGDVGYEWPEAKAPDLLRRDVLVTELDSTLASWHVRRLLNNWPFVDRGTTRPDTLRLSTAIDSLSLDVLRGRLTWLDGTARLGADLERRGNIREALRAALALADEQWYRSTPYLLAANLLVRQQRYATALQYFEAADQREPTLEARRAAGGILFRAGRYDEAVPWLERALALDPNDRTSLFNLGVSKAALGYRDEARALLQRLLDLEPNHVVAERFLRRLEAAPAQPTDSTQSRQ